MDVVIMRELSVMARNEHPNLVRLLGFCHGGPTFDLVLELCRGGALFNLLHLSERQISMRQQLKLAEDVSEGMAYLHRQTPQIMHRDLKSLNVLLHEPVTSLHDVPLAKVTDFGLARARGGPRCWAQSAPQATLQLQERWRPRRHSRIAPVARRSWWGCAGPPKTSSRYPGSRRNILDEPHELARPADLLGELRRRPAAESAVRGHVIDRLLAGRWRPAGRGHVPAARAPRPTSAHIQRRGHRRYVLVNGVHVAVPVLDAWGPPVHPLPTRATSPSFGTSRCSTPQSPEEPWSQLASEANQSSRAKQISSSSICSDSSRYTAVSRLTSRIGSVQWMSPELLLGGENYTSKVDVYAYGMLVYEIFFFEPPFVEFEPDEVESAVLAGVRPDIGCDDVPEQMLRLMRACWHHDAERRPTFEALRCALASFREHDADAFEAFLSP
ncbi:unnamed protein product [Prorocentrum cordatum]|nr:unnamed protein product [Polarella glacialis]